MPSELDLTTAATAASVLGVSAATADLPRLVTVASRAVARFLGYDVHQRTGVVETVASQGGPYLFLRAGQVTALTEVLVNSAAADLAGIVIESVLMGRLRRKDGWPFTGSSSSGVSSTPLHAWDTGELRVTFNAGWVTPGQNALDATKVRALPEDIEQGCLEILTALYRRKGQDADITSRSLGDGSISWGAKRALPETAAAWLAPYRKSTRRLF